MKNTVRILDRAFTELGVTGDYTYLTFTESFRGAGTAELILPADSTAAALLRPDGYIRVPSGLIYRMISVKRDLRKGNVTVYCEGLLSLLRYTVIPEEYNLNGETATLMYHLMRRSVDNLPLPLALDSVTGKKTVRFSSGRSTLYDDLVSLCHLGDVGMKLYIYNGKLTFTALNISDRTEGSTAPMLVSRNMGTFASEGAVWDFGAYRNVAVVSGAEKEAGGRYTVTVRSDSVDIGDAFPDSEYFDRQMLVNFTSPVRPYMFENAEGLLELDENKYLEAMRASGAAALGRCRPKLYLTGSADTDAISVGDRVTVEDTESGISGTAVAQSVTTVYSDKGKSVQTELYCELPAEILS